MRRSCLVLTGSIQRAAWRLCVHFMPVIQASWAGCHMLNKPHLLPKPHVQDATPFHAQQSAEQILPAT